MALSMCGVLTILLHGDFTTLSNIAFNKGDLIFIVALVIFALYSVLTAEAARRCTACRSVAFTFGAGAACLIPLCDLGAVRASGDEARHGRTC